jgi:energy-coupling factor transporter ATP-binding protein EcfA2
MITLGREEFIYHFGGKIYVEYKDHWSKINENNIIDSSLFDRLISEEITIACLVSDSAGTSNYIVLDIDGDGDDLEHTKSVCDNLVSHIEKTTKLSTTVFFSGRKGFHLYIFIDRKIPIFTLRNVGLKILGGFETDIEIEVFPKQTSVDFTKLKYGNHLKLPFSLHPITNQRSVQLNDYILNSYKSVLDLETELLLSTDTFSVINALEEIWDDGKRHKIVMAVSGFFKSNGVAKEKTEEIFTELLKSGGDSGDVLRVIEDTYSNESFVANLTYAPEITNSIANILYSFVATVSPLSPLRNEIVQARLQKQANFLKVDRVARIVITNIKSNYIIYQDGSYFYLANDKETITDSNRSFTEYIHRIGLNVSETFTKQVITHVSNYFLSTGEYLERYLYSRFDKDTREITIFKNNRESVKVTSNDVSTNKIIYPSQSEKIFQYKEGENKLLINLLKTFGLSAGDIDIVISWLVSQFFLEMLNTKPILLVSGPPGSGKTTLASLVLKIVESLHSTSVAYTDKKDSFISSLATHKMLVLDNVEFIDNRTVDFINSITTGTQIELRKLYTTNEKIIIRPNCSICITSAYETFDNDGALASRILTINVPKRESYGSEDLFNQLVSDNYDQIMSEVIRYCQIVLSNLSKVNIKFTALRMTDFIIISKCLQLSNVINTNVERLILDKQLSIRKNSPIFKIFVETVKGDIKTPFTVESIAIKFIARANIYGIKVNMSNLRHKLMATGLFEEINNKLICTL